ncbi:unnamed protein product [Medioppia subpectinata]|uniref:Solute carrier organic anion transporter family member n=1 Tax=Medioppia subpectinata TaxID=1979941 RepID=A0A7R9Q306_9ACAR|nr:unnamed protein product [Medioppia subpectinata]CAG2110000.1 unnamed protein product [Medioppia subpectinata]
MTSLSTATTTTSPQPSNGKNHRTITTGDNELNTNGNVMSSEISSAEETGVTNRLMATVNDSSEVPALNGTASDSENPNTNNNGANAAFLQLVSDDREYSCGLCSIRPKWLQRFANKQTFLAIFCLTSVLQGMYYTYFVSVLTTIEKLYQIQSKTTGMIMSATEIGQIGGALLLTYYGGHGHRPKWIACGMLIFAFASILCSTPHYLFGSDVGATDSSLTPFTSSSMDSLESLNSAKLREYNTKLCVSQWPSYAAGLSSLTSHTTSISESPFFRTNTSSTNWGSNGEPMNWSANNQSVSKCDRKEIINNKSRITNTVLSIFFVSLLLIGIGATAVNTLGIPYIDDNVAPKESPLYFGTSSLTPNDPQWIGAWWLGVFIVGTSLALTSFPMMVFPRRLPQPDPSSYCHIQQQNNLIEQQKLLMATTNGKFKHQLNSSDQNNSTNITIDKQLSETLDTEIALILKNNRKNGKPSLKDFPTAMKRLLRNDILLCRTASSVLHILPIAGLYTFLPKYLESQFQLTATKANMISGMAGIFVMGIGIFASGSFMRKYKPNARFVARWIALAALLYAIGMVILMFLGCPLNNFVGLNVDSENHENTSLLSCSEECSCPTGQYSPICTSTGVTYLSPCLAGCTSVNSSNNEFIYSKCKCLAPNVTAKNGSCPLECNNLVWYIVIFSFFVLIHSTSEVGSMLLTLRCVDPQDKAMALGLISFAIGLFGNVPCPIIYGAVVDSACLFWEGDCGKRGACRVYDPVKFRLVFHGVTALIMFAAFIVDAIVWYKAPEIQFNDDIKPSMVTNNHNKNDNNANEENAPKPDSESIL